MGEFLGLTLQLIAYPLSFALRSQLPSPQRNSEGGRQKAVSLLGAFLVSDILFPVWTPSPRARARARAGVPSPFPPGGWSHPSASRGYREDWAGTWNLLVAAPSTQHPPPSGPHLIPLHAGSPGLAGLTRYGLSGLGPSFPCPPTAVRGLGGQLYLPLGCDPDG